MTFLFENDSHIKTKFWKQSPHHQGILFRSKFIILSSHILISILLLLAPPLHPQAKEKTPEPPPRETEPVPNTGTKPVEQGIRVTGKKDPRDREILRTPNSISRLNEQDIQDAGINRTNDIDKQVPNFSIIDSGSRNFTYFNIRGMRSIAFSEPAVGLILDGVPLNDNVALNTELYGLENIEVYRGSQATLFGKNFQGGVVEIRTKKPTNVAEGKITYDAGNYKNKKRLLIIMHPSSKINYFLELLEKRQNVKDIFPI